MADPLSLAAGTIGVLTAATNVSSFLIKFIKISTNAPRSASIVLGEVNDISGTLSLLQAFLLGQERPGQKRMQMLQANQIVTIMSGCVITFSELERLLDQLKTGDMDVLDCVLWARKEKAIDDLVQRLQNHKASLSLVLNVLNGNSIAEARTSVDRLHEIIEYCYGDMSSRITALELSEQRRLEETSTRSPPEDHTASIFAKGPSTDLEFTEALKKSWVYWRNNAFDTSGFSCSSGDTCSMAWSCLSGVSCAAISNISVINLPIMVDEVRHGISDERGPSLSLNKWLTSRQDPYQYLSGTDARLSFLNDILDEVSSVLPLRETRRGETRRWQLRQ